MEKNTRINLIVAFGESNRCIGKDNKFPDWKLSTDLKNFKKLTTGNIVIMGRKTFESFPEKYRPLPDRINIIITRNKDYVPSPKNNDTHVCYSLEEAITLAEGSANGKKIFIIGGGEIYKQALDSLVILIDAAYITTVKGDFEGDTFFPELSPLDWQVVSVEEFTRDEKKTHDFKIEKLVRSEILY